VAQNPHLPAAVRPVVFPVEITCEVRFGRGTIYERREGRGGCGMG